MTHVEPGNVKAGRHQPGDLFAARRSRPERANDLCPAAHDPHFPVNRRRLRANCACLSAPGTKPNTLRATDQFLCYDRGGTDVTCVIRDSPSVHACAGPAERLWVLASMIQGAGESGYGFKMPVFFRSGRFLLSRRVTVMPDVLGQHRPRPRRPGSFPLAGVLRAGQLGAGRAHGRSGDGCRQDRGERVEILGRKKDLAADRVSRTAVPALVAGVSHCGARTITARSSGAAPANTIGAAGLTSFSSLSMPTCSIRSVLATAPTPCASACGTVTIPASTWSAQARRTSHRASAGPGDPAG
jgi:hypothetical protein